MDNLAGSDPGTEMRTVESTAQNAHRQRPAGVAWGDKG
jgi:hypothetical protein